MIGRLSGNVVETSVEDSSIIVDAHGVGYKVYVAESLSIFKDKTTLYIHTYVREQEISLYGFTTKDHHHIFSLLISVSGVGPKVAMTILSIKKPSSIINAIQSADVDFFTSIPGLGKKGAQKIIIDLKNKLGSFEEIDLKEIDSEIITGLVEMGYDRKRVARVLRKIDKKLPEEQMIKLAMKQLGSGQ
ncbi:Holliday junction branch migration protein RuvA [Patescibacteria group bacterium]